MRYRQPFHEKLENIVEGDRSDDAGGGGGKGWVARAGGRGCACARRRVRAYVRAYVCAREGGMPGATVTYNLCSSMLSDFT